MGDSQSRPYTISRLLDLHNVPGFAGLNESYCVLSRSAEDQV